MINVILATSCCMSSFVGNSFVMSPLLLSRLVDSSFIYSSAVDIFCNFSFSSLTSFRSLDFFLYVIPQAATVRLEASLNIMSNITKIFRVSLHRWEYGRKRQLSSCAPRQMTQFIVAFGACCNCCLAWSWSSRCSCVPQSSTGRSLVPGAWL